MARVRTAHHRRAQSAEPVKNGYRYPLTTPLGILVPPGPAGLSGAAELQPLQSAAGQIQSAVAHPCDLV